METPPAPESTGVPPQPAAASPAMRSDFDSPWKEAIEEYFPAFLAFFFPRIHADIDWDKGYEFLDVELERVVRDAVLGRRYADKLVKVFLRDGTETWLLIHVEVQGYPERDLPERLYVYNYRIFDRYRVEVITLLVLTDDIPSSHWQRYRRARWGCSVTFRFPVVQVRNFGRNWARLERRRNPFAVVVMAHLLAQNVPAGAARKQEKLRLMRLLYGRGYDREEILALFRFIDWLLVLPAELDQEFWEEWRHFEEVQHMPYVTSVERRGIQQGLEQGQLQAAQQMVCEVISARFGSVPDDVRTAVQSLQTPQALHVLIRQVAVCPGMEEVREMLHRGEEAS